MIPGRALSAVRDSLARPNLGVRYGRVIRASGTILEAELPSVQVGNLVHVLVENGTVLAEVVGFRAGAGLLMPYGSIEGVRPGARVRVRGGGATLGVGPELIGRVIDPFGEPLDGLPRPHTADVLPLERAAPAPHERRPIQEPFETGVRVVDGLLTAGRGQRVGLFAGAGVGKTVLIRQIATQAKADVKVIALIGERGCEVADVMHEFDLDSSVLVVATSDRSPLERARGALAATSIAESFAAEGKDVLLVVDSLTRYAMARREVGLAAGELPATKGYPPSVFALLPQLLERVAPLRSGGSITGFYTVLVEGDDLSDPVADSARSLLDGHIVLSRDLAARGHFPAVDVLPSASRVMRQVCEPDALTLAGDARALLAQRSEVEDLRRLGAYQPGQNPQFDEVLALGQRLDGWSTQAADEASDRACALQGLATALGRKGARS